MRRTRKEKKVQVLSIDEVLGAVVTEHLFLEVVDDPEGIDLGLGLGLGAIEGRGKDDAHTTVVDFGVLAGVVVVGADFGLFEPRGTRSLLRLWRTGCLALLRRTKSTRWPGGCWQRF